MLLAELAQLDGVVPARLKSLLVSHWLGVISWLDDRVPCQDEIGQFHSRIAPLFTWSVLVSEFLYVGRSSVN